MSFAAWLCFGGGVVSALMATVYVWAVEEWIAPFTAYIALAIALWLVGIEIVSGSI